MLRLMRADFYRLCHSKGFYIVLAVSAISAGIIVCTNFFPVIGSNETTYNMMLAIKSSKWDSRIVFQAALASYAFFNYVFIGLFIMISGYEFSQNIYKNTLTSGISRTMVILAKNVMHVFTTALATLVYFTVLILLTYVKYGIADSGSSFKNVFFASVCLVLCINVFLSLANILLLITSSTVVSTIFIAAFPLVIQMISSSGNWSWLEYINLFEITQNMAFYELSGQELFPYILVNISIIFSSIMTSSYVSNKKEF